MGVNFEGSYLSLFLVRLQFRYRLRQLLGFVFGGRKFLLQLVYLILKHLNFLSMKLGGLRGGFLL